MASIIGGNESGLLDSSLTILNRNDASRLGNTGHGETSYANVSNGNLIVQQQDAYLPSQGQDYLLVRTYNSRGLHNGKSGMEHQSYAAGWSLSTDVTLNKQVITDPDGSLVDVYEVTYGDGSSYEFRYDSANNIWVSTDGAGAYETLEIVIDEAYADPGNYMTSDPGMSDTSVAYIVTRANQSKYSFDAHGRMGSIEDTNGVRMDFTYDHSRLIQVQDDQGHVLTYNYYSDGMDHHNGKVENIVDETGTVLVSYDYDTWGKLSQVTDRDGHLTTYTYNSYGILESVTMPSEQTVDGVTTTYDSRTISFGYEEKAWAGDLHNGMTDRAVVLSSITDAEGGVTTFDYNFDFSQPDPVTHQRGRRGRSYGGKNATDTIAFLGGNTKVVNALGNNRAYSNDAQYVDWRVANGYYATYDANLAATDTSYLAQVDAIKNSHSLTYSYDKDGYLTEVIDQEQYKTTYTYDALDNLTSIVDRNGYAAIASDSDYNRNIRAELGYVDLAGQGKLVADLTADEKTAILANFTTSMSYDNHGNLLSVNDNQGNLKTYTYTSFNKIASETSAMGNALVTSDEQQYQDKRIELGFAALVADLSATDTSTLRALYTTTYEYDANQNLISKTDPGNNLTQFTYDTFGNLITRTVFLDANDLVSADKQQVTQYLYDAYGNNIETIDGEGNTTFSEYDHFGNLVRFVDGNGGITTYTYDNDNRLITVTDPESHTTTNSYDAVGNRISVTDANGHTVIYIYDKNNMLLATMDPSESNAADNRLTQYQYDVVGNRTAVIDAQGRETNYVFSARFQLLEVITPQVPDSTNGQIRYQSSFTYDGEGNRISQTDNNGNQSQYVYNSNGLLHETTDPIGNVTRYQYDANMNQVQIIVGAQLADIQRRVLKFNYDERDQLIDEVDAEGFTTHYDYNAAGKKISVTDAKGHVTDFVYDKNNRVITEIRPEVTDPVSGLAVRYTVEHRYGANGNEVETINENGNSTKFTFNKDNQAVMVEDANHIKTVFTYDSRHNKTSVSVGADATVDLNGAIVINNADNAKITTYKYDEFNQVISKTDGLGNALVSSDDAQYIEMRANLGYVDVNGNGKLVADLTDPEKSALTALYTEHYSYDKVGNLTQSINNAGNATDISYDGLNRQTSTTDALGNTTTTHYDGNNNKVSVTDALGRTSGFSYDGNNRLIDSTDANGVVTHREYDDFGNLRFETKAFGSLEARTTEYRYDLNNRLTDSIDPLGHQTHYEYDAVGNRTAQTTAFGTAAAETTQYTYDALNRSIQTTDALGNITQYDYDGVGNRVKLIDAKGGLTEFTYDPGNRLVQTTDAEGRVNSFSYDVRGNRITTTDGNGNVTHFEYDAENNLRAVVDALGNRTENDYDTVYNRISTTDGNGHTTTYAFDAINRQIATTDALGNTTNYAFDVVGNRISITDALNHTRSFAYDDLNRVITETNAEGVQTTYTYDEVSNRTSITTAANTAQAATSTFAYNKDNQLLSQTDALGNITSYTYDANHNVTTITDANGGVTTNVYDDNNRIISIVDANGHQIKYAYDENGNRVQVIDANGNTITSYFNADNEEVLTVDGEGYAVENVYDNNGNVIKQTRYMTAIDGAIDSSVVPVIIPDVAHDQTSYYEYDKLNRQTAQIDGEGYRTTTSYDAVGNVISRTDGNGNITTIYYDDINREIQTVNPEGGVISYTYDALGNQITKTDGNGNKTSYVYDLVNRLVTEVSANNIAKNYSYDAVGNRVATTDALGRVSHYEYDAVNQLTKQIDALGVETEYRYDAVGNKLSFIAAANTPQAATTTFEYDADSNLISTIDPLGHATTYTYDANHNRVSVTDANGGTTKYTYDRNNRMVSQVNPLGGMTSYKYDGAGNQIQFIDANGNTTTNYFNANNQLTYQVDAEGYINKNIYDGNGNIITQTLFVNPVTLPVDLNIEPSPEIDVLHDQTVIFEFDGLNREISRTDAEGASNTTRYDNAGNILSITNGNGDVSSFVYDDVNRLIQSVDAEGSITSYEYDNVNNRTSKTDALGRTTSYVYDSVNQLTGEIDAAGIETTYSYDAVGNKTQVISAANTSQFAITNYSYDLDNNLQSETDALGNITNYIYDANHNRVSVINPNGDSTNFNYDSNNRMVSMTDAAGHVENYQYDASGNRTQTIDANGNATTVYYNRKNQVVLSVGAEGYAVSTKYNAAGKVVEIIHHMTPFLGVVDSKVMPEVVTDLNIDQLVQYEYDKTNRQVTEIDGEGKHTTNIYDSVGNVVSKIDPNGNVTSFAYDEANRLLTTTDANGGVTSNTYDAVGNRTSQTDANGNVTTYVFDVLNRLTSSTDALGHITTNTYDAVGNRISTTDANGHTTNFTFDLNKRVVKQTDAFGIETTYSFDGVGNRLSMTTAANTAIAATTTYTYNADNNMSSMTDALGNTTSYSYDATHNRTSMTDAKGHVTTYIYDKNNRLISQVDAENNAVSYIYDGVGNKVQYTDENGNVSTTYYNKRNEAVISVDASGYATTNVYDDNGNVTTSVLHMSALALPLDPGTTPAIINSSNDQTTTYEYDALNRTSVRIDAEGYRTEYAYDSVGNQTQTRQQITADGSVYAVTNTYFNDINQISHSISAEGYLTSYAYDAAGNRISSTIFNEKVTVPTSGTPVPVSGDTGRTTTSAYDANNRLSSKTSALGIVTTYQYDERGNRISMVDAQGTADQRITIFSYDNLNRLIDTTKANGVVTHNVYDNVGNVTERYDAYGSSEQRLTTFSYDANNRLLSKTNALGVVTSYQYDASGNTLSTTLASGMAGIERTLTNEYDANNRMIAEVNGEGERTEYVFDGAGNRTETIQAPGITGKERHNTFEFDKDNQLVASVDAMGVRTEYTYDGAGNKLVSIQAVGLSEQRSSQYRYNLDNQLIEVTDPESGVTQYSYDSLGNQVQVIDANGGIQINSFDAVGQSIASLSAGGILSRSVYDNRGNLIAITQSFADGSNATTTTYSYDAIDQQVSITDGEGFTSTITYDAFGNQVVIVHGEYLADSQDPSYDPLKAARSTSEITTFTYDADSRMTSMTDGEGNSTIYTYDEVGNRLTLTKAANDPDLSLTTYYQYDLANRLTQTLTPEGGITNQTYDALGNKVSETLLQGFDTLGTEVWISRSFEYNANGKMTAEIDGEGVRTEHGYDAMGNLVTTRNAAGTADERLVRMEYDFNNRKTAEIDAEGNRTEFAYDARGNRVKVTDSLGRVAHFYFDGENQLVSSLDPEGYVNTFTYDASGNKTEVKVYMTRYTGTVNDFTAPVANASSADRSTKYIYDNAKQLVVEIDAEGNETHYEYNGAGKKTKETQYANSTSPRVLTYTYDNSSRLVGFTDVDGSITTFTYDAANNKTSESIYNAQDPNTTRTTVYTYDKNNRETSSVFDPDGLALTQTQTFDKLGNLVASSDKNGTVTSFQYDLNNRMLSQTVDPKGLAITTSYSYDAVGNRSSMTDARGFTTDYRYDNNNNLIEEKLPAINTYSISGGLTTGVRPTQTYSYDAAGNQTQIVDSNGNVTTRYYDSNNRVVAELDSLNTLREYSYNAAGDQVTKIVYMTQLSSAEHVISNRPVAPAGETRLYVMEYDKAGRLTRTVYPETTITTLLNPESDSPTTSTITKSVEVKNTYDVFGNKVEVVDANGNRSLSYYDVNGNQVAVVDGAGYMIEWQYDQQGNVLEQRTYANPLDTSLLSASEYPATPAGDVHVISRTYDTASNLLTETSPGVPVYNPQDPSNPIVQQQVVVNTYDGNGNVTSKTIAAGTSLASTEYSYYDAANRRIAVINSERVLHQYEFDANNNITRQTRYINTIAESVDLSSLSASSDFLSLVSVDDNGDQTTVFSFDANNRQTSKSDLMGPGVADDITETYQYDTTTHRTFIQNAEGYITQSEFDGNGNVVLSISADGSGTIFTYDAVGNRILAYTGQVDNQTTPASNISVTVGEQLNLNWDLAGNVSMGSRVVYGTSSHAGIGAYSSQTGLIGSWGQSAASANIDLSQFAAGDSVYFRVVTQDSAGNKSWTEEKMITIPPRVTDVSISQPATDSLEIIAHFDAGAINPVLLYGAPQNPATPVNFVLQTDGSYTATLTGVTNAEDLVYKLQWQDASGQTYNSAEQPFEASGNHVAVTTTAGEGTISTGGYEITTHTEVPASLGDTLTLVTAKWRAVGSNTGYYATANSGVLNATGAFYNYDLTLSQTTAMTAGTYEIIISGAKANGDEVVLDTFNYTVGSATPETLTSQSVSWQAPHVGNSQVVIVDGERVDSTRQDGFASFDVNLAAGTQNYQVYYSDQVADAHTTDLTNAAISHTVDVNSAAVTVTNPDLTTTTTYDLAVTSNFSAAEVAQMASDVTLSYRPAGSSAAFTDVVLTQSGNSFSTNLGGLAAGQYELQLSYTDVNAATVIASTTTADTAVASNSTTYTSAYNLNISSVLSAAEVANISGDVTLYYRDANTGLDFVNSKVMTLDAATNTLTASLDNIPAGQYDVKLAYTDVNGKTVILDWSRADTSVENTSLNSHSETLLGAEEQNGSVTLGSNGVMSVNPGLFIGDLGTSNLFSQLSLNTANTGLAGDTQNANGQSTGYYAETTFNALDEMVSEVGRDGLYREYGVDGNGNQVATYLYGDKAATSSIDSFTAYDARNRSVAKFEAAFIPEGETQARHPVTRYEYNFADAVTKETNELGYVTRTEYSALGSKTKVIDANGGVTTYQYDIRGNEVAVTDASGKTARKEYDASGHLMAEVNGAGDYMRYEYDAFGRKTAMTKGLNEATPVAQGFTTSYSYDQHDRMTTKTDALGGVSRYDYDKLDNQTWAYDTRYNPADAGTYTFKYGQEFDSLGRVVTGISYQGGKEVTETVAVLDQYGNPTYDLNGDPVTTTTTHFVGGEEIRETITYDVYGNRIAQTDGEGRVKTFVYGGASRVIEEVDEGGQRTIKEYNQYGQLVHEYDPNGTKDIVRSYDFNGNLVSIVDNGTGVSTTYGYDIAGNKVSETITTPTDAQGEGTHNRSYTYMYDSRGNLVRWADSVTGMHLNYWYDESGNLQRVFTDVGYDPDNQNTANDPNFQQVDHWYYYDSANRLSSITKGENGDIISGYTYDNAGNRNSWNNQGTAVTYEFDANGRVTKGTWYSGTGTSQVEHTQVWKYDTVGNVVDYRTYDDGAEKTYSTYKYFENNKQWYSDSDGSKTTNTFDKSGRQTKMQMVDGDKTYNYTYSYYADGREKSIKANGDASGSSSFSYDSNKNKIRVDKGNGDGQDRNQYSTFMYDNEGHIMYKWADDGKSATREKVDYSYANGNPTGETGNDTDGVHTTKLDTGNYNTVKNFGDEFPTTSVTLYTVNPGDTLQSIAGAMYGNPSLWYVIAEANGLNGTEQLKEGSKLQVPNSVENGHITNDSHALYQENDIIGSSLPNLVSPPPPSSGGGCGTIIMIIIVVVIAIVSAGALAGVAANIGTALFAGTTLAGTVAASVISGALAGAFVYAVGNIVQQGLFIALGFQDSFEWGQVGDAAVTGLFTGAASGIAAASSAGTVVDSATKLTEGTAKIAAAATKVAGAAISQYLKDGEITNWTSIAVAALGSTNTGKVDDAGKAIELAGAVSSETLGYVSPWLQLAETYVRNDGKLEPADWATAVTGTVTNAINSSTDKTFSSNERLGARLLTNVIVGGALAQSDKAAAESYFTNSVGNEIGSLFGGAIETHLRATRIADANKARAAEVGHFDGSGNPEQLRVQNAQSELNDALNRGDISVETFDLLTFDYADNPDVQKAYAELHFLTKSGVIQDNEFKDIMANIDFNNPTPGAVADAMNKEISLSKEFNNTIRNFDVMEKYSELGKGIILASDPAQQNELIIPITVPAGKSVDQVYDERMTAYEKVQRAFNTQEGQKAPTGEGLEGLRRFALDDYGNQTIAALNNDINFDINHGLRDESGRITDDGIFASEGMLGAGKPNKKLFEIRGHEGLGASANENFIDIGSKFLSTTHTGGDKVFAPAVIAHEFGHTRYNLTIGYDPARTVEAGYSESIANNAAARGIGSAQLEFNTVVSSDKNPFSENAYRSRYGVPERTSYTFEDGTTYPAVDSAQRKWPFTAVKESLPAGALVNTFKAGDSGAEVKSLQKKLMQLGYDLPDYGADGKYGKETSIAYDQYNKEVNNKVWKISENGKHNLNLGNIPSAVVQVIYGEASGTSYESKLAVANVINNRLNDSKYEFRKLNSYEDVVFQKNAFEAVGGTLYNNAAKPDELSTRSLRSYNQAGRAAINIGNKYVSDSTSGALYYYSPYIHEPKYITDGLKNSTLKQVHPKGTTIDEFRFFRRAQ